MVQDRKVWARRSVIAAVFLIVILGGYWLIAFRKPDVPVQASALPEEFLPRQVARSDFVSSDSCKNCHPDQFESWYATYHRTMTQVATPETVLAPFDNVELSSRGRSMLLERSDDEFWVTLVDPAWEASQTSEGRNPSLASDPPRVRKPVVMTTGSHHMQGYWFPSGNGNELLQIPFYYSFDDERWIPREDVFLRPAVKDPVLANWNITCIKCHSVSGIPGGVPEMTSFDTEVAELGIACEACHGPGRRHVALYSDPRNHGREGIPGDPIVNPARAAANVQSEICGQCHSEFWPADPLGFWSRGMAYQAGDDFERTHLAIRFNGPIYRQFEEKYRHTFWNDGTCRVGGDEYNGLIESPCYQRGDLSCLSCHSMHEHVSPNDLLAMNRDGNQACQQCHVEPRFNESIQTHTHHASGSDGSRCYNCHMPHTSYALFTAMRSHRVTSPHTQSLIDGNRPNACNLCHLDQSLQWTAGYLEDWYGDQHVDLPEDETVVAASLLWLLRGDAIQRAIAAWHMGWPAAHSTSGTYWQAPFLAQLLDDPYMGVRYQAIRALKQLPGHEEFDCDFIGTDEHRQELAQDVQRSWRENLDVDRLQQFDQILLTPEGELQTDFVQRLMQQRDDSFVRIPE